MWCSVWIMQNLYFHYDLCTGHFIDFVLFWGFFLFIATMYIFADCNNELLVKKKYILLIIRTMYMYFFE